MKLQFIGSWSWGRNRGSLLSDIRVKVAQPSKLRTSLNHVLHESAFHAVEMVLQ